MTDRWEPARVVSVEECVRATADVAALPTLDITDTEDVFRIDAAGMQWDIGVHVHEPVGGSTAVGADGRKIGVFLLHGGQDDWRQMLPFATMLAAKFGYKVVTGTFPGRLNLQDPSRDWPGDTINPDGTVRTPIWLTDELITADQYDVVKDTRLKARYGTRTVVHAKPGTAFWFRLAASPLAMEAGMVEAMRRHFPVDEFSVYMQGHSTGGAMTMMLAQRVPNCAGLLAAENSMFGVITERMQMWSGSLGKVEGYDLFTETASYEGRVDPFYEVYLRSWRDIARYYGPEALGKEGPAALMRLPSLMEEVLDGWDRQLVRPLFKCEYPVTHNIVASLTQGAQVTAERLGLSHAETQEMVEHYLGFTRELSGPGVKPMPHTLFGIARHSRDASPEAFEQITLPHFAAMSPPPRVGLQHFQAGTHMLWRSEPNLPRGILPAVVQQWDQAITQGFFVREGHR
jgi:pimeloyl-ACP methyl ester carboxylesterase